MSKNDDLVRRWGYIVFLREAARYFEKRPTNGEDAAYWSNAYNAKNCREIADAIERGAAQGVRVKPLEWRRWPEDGGPQYEGLEPHRKYIARALTPFGAIFVMSKHGTEFTLIVSNGNGTDNEVHGSEDDAKAAAQADYERRILSARDLSTPPAPAPDAREERRCSCGAPVWVKNPLYHANECALNAATTPQPPAVEAGHQGEKCDDCARHYKLVYRVPNDVWSKIAPHPERLGEHPEHQGGGLLCPDCAFDRAAALDVPLYFDAAENWPAQPPAVEAEAVKPVAWRYKSNVGNENSAWLITQDPQLAKTESTYPNIVEPLYSEAVIKAKTDENERLTEELRRTDIAMRGSIQAYNTAEASNKALREKVEQVIAIYQDDEADDIPLAMFDVLHRALLSEKGGE